MIKKCARCKLSHNLISTLCKDCQRIIRIFSKPEKPKQLPKEPLSDLEIFKKAYKTKYYRTIYKFLPKGTDISVTWVQRKFKVTFSEAINILDELREFAGERS